jgi:hypothetical protein
MNRISMPDTSADAAGAVAEVAGPPVGFEHAARGPTLTAAPRSTQQTDVEIFRTHK